MTTRRSNFTVGLAVLAAVAVVIAAAIWLGDLSPGGPRTLQVARFRTLGGVGVGDPVVLRGVKVGRVEAIRLAADDWVEADLRISQPDELPPHPVAIAVSASLFGEWQVAVMDSARAPTDPDIRRELRDARVDARDRWPGATLPDVGQLTAQASRIASDVAAITNRIEGAVDSAAIADIRSSVRDLRRMADQLVSFTQQQTGQLERVVGNAATSSGQIARASGHLETTLSRIDSSTAAGEIDSMVRDARDAASELKQATGDLRLVTSTARDQRERLVSILANTDSALSRLNRGEGTLGMLSADTVLYKEATRTVVQLRSLLADIQANPRRYFRFSVF